MTCPELPGYPTPADDNLRGTPSPDPKQRDAEQYRDPASDDHEHGDWDQGGYCNRMVMRSGFGDTCGYRHPDSIPKKPKESNLVTHARRELALLGYSENSPDKMDYDIYLSTMAIVKAFSTVGHSGGSAGIHTMWINRLLQFENITPITDDPEDWMEVHLAVWQNRRASHFFSNNGGKTYWSVNEFRTGWRAKLFGRKGKIYTSKSSNKTD